MMDVKESDLDKLESQVSIVSCYRNISRGARKIREGLQEIDELADRLDKIHDYLVSLGVGREEKEIDRNP